MRKLFTVFATNMNSLPLHSLKASKFVSKIKFANNTLLLSTAPNSTCLYEGWMEGMSHGRWRKCVGV